VGMVKGEVWRNRSQHELEGKSCLGIGQMSNYRKLFWSWMTDMGTDRSVFLTLRREHFWSWITDVGRGLSAPLGTYLGGDIFKALNTFNGRHKIAL
jgi:hypothetical protein